MSMETKRCFDFSEDAPLFKKRLLRHLKEAAYAQPLEDDELEFLNAAGTNARAPKEEDFPFNPPLIP